MRRVHLVVGAALLATLSFGVTACGGSSSGGSSSAAVDTEKQGLVDELMTQLEGDGTITDEQKTCLRDQFGGFTVDELKTIKDSSDGSNVPQALQDKVVNMVLTCVGGQTGAPSPAAS
ncbi:MAG: hypothetical protein ACR2KE_09455 [Candidatus Nanopelagicales bacterium]